MGDAGYDFEVIPSPASELNDPGLSLIDLTTRNARRKADAVAERYPRTLVIGADTLVFIDSHALGKPRDRADAIQMIERLNGRTHQVCTGVCLCRREPRKTKCFHEITSVTFKKLDRAEIEAYLAKINPLDKAGAYAAQEHGSLIIDKTEGSWTNVVGLPMERLSAEIARFDSSD